MKSKIVAYPHLIPISSDEAAAIFWQTMHELLEKKGLVTVGVPGGRSVKSLFQKIASFDGNLIKGIAEKIHFFQVDERLTNDYQETNRKVIEEDLLRELEVKGFPTTSFHFFDYSTSDVRDALKKYDMELKSMLVSEGEAKLDVLILSSGEDGHICSLFPRSASLHNKDAIYLHVTNSPKRPLERISISPGLIFRADVIFLLFSGEEKRDAYIRFLDVTTEVEECPAILARMGRNNSAGLYLLGGEGFIGAQ